MFRKLWSRVLNSGIIVYLCTVLSPMFGLMSLKDVEYLLRHFATLLFLYYAFCGIIISLYPPPVSYQQHLLIMAELKQHNAVVNKMLDNLLQGNAELKQGNAESNKKLENIEQKLEDSEQHNAVVKKKLDELFQLVFELKQLKTRYYELLRQRLDIINDVTSQSQEKMAELSESIDIIKQQHYYLLTLKLHLREQNNVIMQQNFKMIDFAKKFRQGNNLADVFDEVAMKCNKVSYENIALKIQLNELEKTYRKEMLALKDYFEEEIAKLVQKTSSQA